MVLKRGGTFTFIIIGLVIFVFVFVFGVGLFSSRCNRGGTDTDTMNAESVFVQPRPNTFFTNQEGDTLSNPYAPPLKDVFFNGAGGSVLRGAGPGVPINMATNTGATVNASYQQIGLLTKADTDNRSKSGSSSSSDPVIMPLMGKPLFTSRDKWLFYTISDKNNAMKLPIIIKGRNALSEIGVDNVYTGDTVYVQGYNDQFKVTLYENSAPQYIPFI
jgi:Family of unknown function (DUF5755)